MLRRKHDAVSADGIPKEASPEFKKPLGKRNKEEVPDRHLLFYKPSLRFIY
jgi:hypothetical protein